MILFLVSNLFYGEDDSNENQEFLYKDSRCCRQKSTEPKCRAEIPLSQETLQGTSRVDQAVVVRRNSGGRVHPGSFVQVFRFVFGQPGLGCPPHRVFQGRGFQSVPGYGRGQVDNPAEKRGLAGQPAATGFGEAAKEVMEM